MISHKTKDWKFKKKKCIICNGLFKPKNGKQKTCGLACGKTRKKIHHEEYRKDNLEKWARHSRNWQKKNRDKSTRNMKRYIKENPRNTKIRNKTRKFIRERGIKYCGECQDCGVFCKREIHHLKYTTEDFIFLCRNCHYNRHNKENRK